MTTNKTIIELLVRLQGIDVSKYEVSFLNQSIQKRIKETYCSNAEAYCALLDKNENEGNQLIAKLNISYSEFFRNPLTFAVLERIILPSMVLKKGNTKRNEIRIWSAACAAGEEIYSLAVLLEEFKTGVNEKINFRIFATDQNDSLVNSAIKGQYAPDALNNLSLKRINQWFTHSGDTYTVKHELKKNIDFSVFDLFSAQYSCPPSSIYGDFDLVVCANLLFYYGPEYQKIILKKAGNCLAKEGYLVTGETERDIVIRHNYQEVYPHSAIFQSRVHR